MSMRRLASTVPAVLALIGPLGNSEADEPKSQPRSAAALTTFDALQGRLNAPLLRLLDARPRADYEKAHIPGAVWVDTKAAEKLAARPGGLEDKDAWKAWVAPLGIAPRTEVLVYDASRQLDAARIWWLLSYLGVEKAGLIDGGFPLWQGQGRPVTAEVARVDPVAFPVAFRTARQATRLDVLEALKSKSAQIIDARSVPEHTGDVLRSRRGGHIPSACSLEWVNLVDRDGRFLVETALRARLERSGVRPGEPVIIHCQSGGRASVDAFVMERLGFPTRNYYLGWSDWGNNEETPVETGKRQGKTP
jgi:thiosulfate/3-mercaptopyruvate sulfurtransferase